MSFSLRKTWIVYLGFLISLFLLYLAFRQLDWAQFWIAIKKTKIFPWIPLAIVAYFTGHFIRGIRLHYLVSQQCNLRVFTATNIVVLGYAVNNILPARLGELARIGMLHERTGLPIVQCATVTFLERVLDGIAILILFLFSSQLVGSSSRIIGDTVQIVGAVLLSGLFLISIAVLFPHQLTRFALLLAKGLSARSQEILLRAVSYIINGVAYLRSPKNALRIFIWSFIVWLIESLTFLFVLPASELAMNPLEALFVMSVVNLAILIPSTPGYIGPFHYFVMKSLMLFGVVQSKALSYAFVVHSVIYIPLTIWGLAIIYWYSIQLKKTLSLAKDAKQATNTVSINGVEMKVLAHLAHHSKDKKVSTQLKSVVHALLSPEIDDLEGKTKMIDRVADQFQGQLNQFNPLYRFAFKLGMFCFDLYTLLRYGRFFDHLSTQQKQKAVHDWAYGNVPFARQFFRLIRSSTVLIFYDQIEKG